MASRRVPFFILLLCLAVTTTTVPAGQVSPPQGAAGPSLFAEMRWRSIGPHRASRTRSAAAHSSQPYTFYAGVVNGAAIEDREKFFDVERLLYEVVHACLGRVCLLALG